MIPHKKKFIEYDIPILFIVFNRPETTFQVFDQIKSYKPGRLYIAADGPREDRIGEEKLCEETRQIIKKINWPCEVKTLFRDKNLGCKKAVYLAVDWFFENEEMGIILEDDCVPNNDFFYFCNKMLIEYQDNQNIGMITGTNYFSFYTKSFRETFFFSKISIIWGWATWKNRWKDYDPNMSDWNKNEVKDQILNSLPKSYLKEYFRWMFNQVYSERIDTWDFQWTFTNMLYQRLCITPKVNLVCNIGIEGAHGKEKSKSQFLKTLSIDFKNITFPKEIKVNDYYDNLIYEKKYRPIVFNWKLDKIKKILGLKFAKRILKKILK